MSGFFISFEGVDGSGKSTQSRLLAGLMEREGHDVVLTREPGGSPGAEEIRELLVAGDPGRWSAETEILLFTAARRDHLERMIAPALEAGKIVICDRFADSTRVYQGVTRGELRQTVDTLHDTMIAREPDLTLIVDMDPASALDRALERDHVHGANEDRFEEFGLPFQHKLRAGFNALAAEFADRCVIIDGNRGAHDVAADVERIVRARLP